MDTAGVGVGAGSGFWVGAGFGVGCCGGGGAGVAAWIKGGGAMTGDGGAESGQVWVTRTTLPSGQTWVGGGGGAAGAACGRAAVGG